MRTPALEPSAAWIVPTLFASGLAGLAGLVYEVLWSRQLTSLLGASAYAHVAVIVSFLVGLTARSGPGPLQRISLRRA